MKKLKVYVAGAYSDNNVLGVLRNIGRGQYWTNVMFLYGFAPFCPWFDKEFVISEWRMKYDVDMFYSYSIAWLEVSDVVFVVPDEPLLKNWRDSTGTLKEIERANELGIPVYYELDKILTYAREKGFEIR